MPNPNVEFYEQYDWARLYGWTPSIVSMNGGVSTIDSYTPVSYARYTIDRMRDYLQRPTGREISTQEIVDYLYKVADRFGIDRDIAYRQIEAESGFNPKAKSPKGAVGVAQFMPDTAARYGLNDRTDPYASLDAWGAYMSDLLKMNDNDYERALASYNWGEGKVLEAFKKWGASWLGKAPQETRNYVRKIMGDWKSEEIWVDENGNIVPPGTPGATRSVVRTRGAGVVDAITGGFDLPGFLEGDTAKDVGKRVGLVVLAALLLIAAIVSLR
jgi:hypothetical protein